MLFVVLNVSFIITVFICCFSVYLLFSVCLLFQCVCCFSVHSANGLLSLLYNTLFGTNAVDIRTCIICMSRC